MLGIFATDHMPHVILVLYIMEVPDPDESPEAARNKRYRYMPAMYDTVRFKCAIVLVDAS